MNEAQLTAVVSCEQSESQNVRGSHSIISSPKHDPGARATAKSVLIIGPDPRYIDFSAPYLPPGMSAEKIIAGVDGARDRLADAGYSVQVLLTKNEETVDQQVSDALKERSYDVTVVGVGLRTLSPMAAHFERLINSLHEKAPRTKIAFNSKPDDSDAAALRWL